MVPQRSISLDVVPPDLQTLELPPPAQHVFLTAMLVALQSLQPPDLFLPIEHIPFPVLPVAMHNVRPATLPASAQSILLTAMLVAMHRLPILDIPPGRSRLPVRKKAPIATRKDLLPGRISRREWLRFMKKVKITPDGHWLWQGSRGKFGHGRYRWRGLLYSAPRFAYVALRGAVPEGLEPDHKCRIPPCVYPWCLELVTHETNTMRSNAISALNRLKTHCKHGHPFDEENTYWIISRKTLTRQWRQCKACQSARQKIAQRARRDQRAVSE